MLNPAYLVQIQNKDGSTIERWILPSDAQTEIFDQIRIHPEDFHGIEYTMLSIVKSPFDWMILFGFVIAGIGCLALFKTSVRSCP